MTKTITVAGAGLGGRVKKIRKYCKNDMPVVLKREPHNEHDSNATAVYLRAPILFGLFGTQKFKISHG